MAIHPIIRQIVNRQHVGQSNRSIIHAVIHGLKHKRKTFFAMPKTDRKEFMRQAIAAHAENRQEYRCVMGSH